MRMILKYVLYYLCFMSCCGSLENMFSLNLIKIPMGGDEEFIKLYLVKAYELKFDINQM